MALLLGVSRVVDEKLVVAGTKTHFVIVVERLEEVLEVRWQMVWRFSVMTIQR